MSKTPWKLVFTGWAAGLSVSLLLMLIFASGLMGFNLYSWDLALIPLFTILGSMITLMASNWFWCKIPLPLKHCRSLGFILLLIFPIYILPHPEIGWKSLLLFMELGEKGLRYKVLPGHMIVIGCVMGLMFVYFLAPWFVRRFFFEHLPD